MNNNVSRQQCIDLWMATDRDRSTLFDHLHRFAVALHASDKRDAAAPIAPAEAKGDVFSLVKEAADLIAGAACEYPAVAAAAENLRRVLNAPQPADGGAVAWQWRLRGVDTDLEWVTRCKPLPDSITNDPACEVRALYTHQPAAQVQECHMRGRCECIGACKYGLGGNGAMECPACRLEAALQHRGDSRGGEGS